MNIEAKSVIESVIVHRPSPKNSPIISIISVFFVYLRQQVNVRKLYS